MQDLRFNSNIYYFNNRIESTSEYVINKIGQILKTYLLSRMESHWKWKSNPASNTK